MEKELLLQEISRISKKHELINRKTGKMFNIFEILNVETDEVRICRFIYELLNPKGRHYRGSVYLKLFIKSVLKIEMYEEEFKSIKVYREYVLEDNRRIDLAIRTNKRFIPIEVKIYAEDEKNQCADYYKFARLSKVYYLTLYGKSPGEYSALGLTKIGDTYEEVANISFESEIRLWLEKCLRTGNTMEIGPIREVIRQMISVIDNLTYQGRDEKGMEISLSLLKSKERFKSAMEIEKSLPLAKSKIMLNLFESVKDELLEDGREILLYGKEDIEDYYDKRKKYIPTLGVKIKDLGNNLVAAISLEVDHKLYFHYSFMSYDKVGKIYKNKAVSEVKKTKPREYEEFSNGLNKIVKSNRREEANILHWEYVNYDNREYNFKLFTESCVDLLENGEDVAKSISLTIRKNIDHILELLEI